jgi:hypothetical protein
MISAVLVIWSSVDAYLMLADAGDVQARSWTGRVVKRLGSGRARNEQKRPMAIAFYATTDVHFESDFTAWLYVRYSF